jgi:glycosyltransferase involved in cell wall biosynthesis
MDRTGISVVIPAFNEEEGIGPVLDGILETMPAAGLEFEVLVVDDGSRDRTAAVARAHNVCVLSHPQNRGYGAALKTGIRRARYDLIAITDADGTYPYDRLPDLARHAVDGHYDMVVGARTGDNVHIPLARRPAKWALTHLANYLAGLKIPDLNSGLRVFQRDAVKEFFRLLPSGFSFTTTVTLALLTNDFSVDYMPIDYHARTGRSKIRPVRDTIGFFSLVVRLVLSFRPLRVLVPLSLVSLGLSMAKVFYDVYVYDFHLATSTVVLVTLTFQIIVLGMIADLVVSLHKS